MFTLCKGTHVDPAYYYAGTVDYAIINEDTTIVLAFSIVHRGPRRELQIITPMTLDDFLRVSRAPGTNSLQEAFMVAAKLAGHQVSVECSSLDPASLMPVLEMDMQALSSEDRAALDSAIGEVFA